mmetsp:Transcript_17054/g.50910  ORF Transcript_17054/g.50910 Transcript_17054/m.50910 type:complete len:629 (+) Transcript_17054:196-2082(+)|eukprot:CAMPEP_0206139798 /NCGR_PEP_ID=MMETSP1473-20131121/7334_1 /ASSEMBLY_ACC=CAM_ASM_001109 /TAXON_ID=1461547 /ORGANISM="Stichococcus sp, Strain RCC1054" /LENGTH=628 /DNA_ID=CAMNT_0053533705 /DNA_START=177 /DNA_END=2063 /DNA_ORIENTATION=-
MVRRGRGLLAIVAALAAGLAVCSFQVAAQLHAEVTSQHPRIYVAPLPDIFNYRVLTDYDVKRFFHQFGTDPQALISQPIGAIENKVDGMELRNTYMYGLDIIFHTQLLQSPLRVHSQEEADIIYLPFYAALECRLSQAMEGDAHKQAYKKRVDSFWATFERDYPYYRDKPHAVVLGRREAELMGGCGVGDAMYGKVAACTLLCHDFAEYVNVLTVEVWTGSLEKMQRDRQRVHSIAVPWPGHLHLAAGSEYFQRPLRPAALAASKTRLAMESLRVRFPLRETLAEQCQTKGDPDCLHFNPRGNIGQMNQSEIYEVTHSAWFCLQPYGDGPSRHVSMDCMAADTIPVFFDRYLLQHSAFADVVDYSEFTAVVNPKALNKSNIVDILKERFPPEKRAAMAMRLHQIKHIFLYAVNPQHTLIRFDEMAAIHPQDDAFTSSMKALLRHACSRGTLSAARCAGKPLPSQTGGVGGGSVETGVKRRRRKRSGDASSGGVARSAPDVSDRKGGSDSEEAPRRSSSIAGSAVTAVGGETSIGGTAHESVTGSDTSNERATAIDAALTGAATGASIQGASVTGASGGGVSAEKVAEAKPVPKKKRTVWDATKGAMVTVDESDAPGGMSSAGYEDSAE